MSSRFGQDSRRGPWAAHPPVARSRSSTTTVTHHGGLMPRWLPIQALYLVAVACGGAKGACDEDADCDDGFACVTQDTATAQICATACVDSFDCAAGFACDRAADKCVEVNW